MLKQLPPYYSSIIIGCDPEFFFSKKNKAIGAEKFLPKNGLVYKKNTREQDGRHTAKGLKNSKIIIDGVQAELNPRPNTCRANLGNEISACFMELYEKIKEKDIKCDFSQGLKITKKEMNSLSEQAKQFGCAPSQNAYKKKNEITIKDASKYMFRSAGGHIHLGGDTEIIKKVYRDNHKNLIQILDILLGNTCVLIDRDKSNIERRKVYGQAGEYRLPPHGLEYRTLSNFWLQSYQLMSFVTGLARQAVMIVITNNHKPFLKRINRKNIMTAINKNDKELAMKNFKKIIPLISTIIPYNSDGYPLTKQNIKAFLHFIKKDISHWFPEDPLHHWIHLPEGHDTGWETFIKEKVTPSMTKI